MSAKLGRSVEVGDVLKFGREGFEVRRFGPYEPPTGGAGRIAYNYRGEGMVVFDDGTARLQVTRQYCNRGICSNLAGHEGRCSV